MGNWKGNGVKYDLMSFIKRTKIKHKRSKK